MKLPPRFHEMLFYALGILLILGFMALYSTRFLFQNAMPPAITYLFYGQGRGWAIVTNAGVFLLFLIFLPYRRAVPVFFPRLRKPVRGAESLSNRGPA